LWSRERLIAVLLAATLIAVAGCSLLAPKANAQGFQITIQSRQVNGATVNLGMVSWAGGVPFVLPRTGGVGPGQVQIQYYPAAGYYFVKWESSTTQITFANINMNPTTVTLGTGAADGIITAVYQQAGLSVGGVILPANTYMTLVPYLVMIGLVATTAIAIRKRRN